MGRIIRHPQADNNENGHVKHSEGNGTEKKNNTTHFVERVTSIPLVKDGVSTAQAIANKTYLGRFALSQMNTTYNTVSQFATNNQPIQTYYKSYFEPTFQKADEFGCKSLDVIQSKVPIMNQPSSDIYRNVITKPTHELIGQAKIKLDSTISTVTHPAHLVIQETNKRLGIYVDNLEGVVDKYLPVDEKDTNVSRETNDNQVIRVYDLFNNASRRITLLVSNTIPKSRGDLSLLAENNSILQNITSQVRLLQETLVQSISIYGNLVQENLPATVTTRAQKTSELFAHVSVTINDQLSQLVDYVKTQPDWVKEKLQLVIDSTKNQLASLKQEFARKDINYIDKLKLVAGSIQDQVLPLLQQLSSQLVTLSDLAREKAQNELNVPLHYFGLNQKIHTQ